jgi:peptide/nickel transport system ATP-binding protein/oligopeptide transport system ATP-binding protein
MEDNRKNILEVKNLHTYFYTDSGVVKSVDGVDFELKEGSTLGIVGESGSGKSVTSLSIMGLLTGTTGKIAEGEILLEGKDIAHISEEEKRKLRGSQISMIFQEPMTSLNPVMKIGKQLTECILQHQDISKEEAWKKAEDMLRRTGVPRVEHMMKEYPFQLSGGQRQRVMIAMALVCGPKILIADEPTTALDVTIQAQILDLMNGLKKAIGTSILFITHDLGVVAEVCDEVVVMYCGRVVEKGDVAELFAHPSHPYTIGLLNSIPKLGEAVEELEAIPGNVPNPKYMPKGCKFAPRCSRAFAKCHEEEPGFYEVGNGHVSRCWLCEKGGN